MLRNVKAIFVTCGTGVHRKVISSILEIKRRTIRSSVGCVFIRSWQNLKRCRITLESWVYNRQQVGHHHWIDLFSMKYAKFIHYPDGWLLSKEGKLLFMTRGTQASFANILRPKRCLKWGFLRILKICYILPLELL